MPMHSSSAYLEIPRTGTPIRDNIEFLKDIKAFHQRIAAINPVVTAGGSFLKATLLFGPEANAFVLTNKDQQFSSEMGWEIILKRVFPGSIMAMDGKHHRYQRRIMNYAFKKDVLVNYLAAMHSEIDQLINAWQPNESFLVFSHIKQLTLDLASNIFMGIDLDAKASKINHAFINMVRASTTPIRVPIPFTPMWKGVRARQYMVRFLHQLLPEKRQQKTADFFSQFCHAVSEDNEYFTDTEIVDHMAFLMMAAHDTTTSTLTTMFYLLAKHTDWQARIREESMALNKTYIDYDDLHKLDSIKLVMQEALRMYPALPSMIRGVAKTTHFSNYELRAGEIIGISPIHSHFCPDLWSNPQQFDPLRFSEPRNEHKTHSHAFIAFGGGAHKCLGQHFAEMQVKSILHQIVQKYQWRVDPDYTMPYQHVPIGQPKDGLPVKFTAIR